MKRRTRKIKLWDEIFPVLVLTGFAVTAAWLYKRYPLAKGITR